MGNAATVDAAALTALAAVVAALVSWLMNRDVARTARETAREVETLKGSLGRELASHEARLRVEAEVRLRMFDRSVEAVQQALHTLHDGSIHAVELASALRISNVNKSDKTDMELFRRTATADAPDTKHGGVLLPPELEDEYDVAAETVLGVCASLQHLLMSPQRRADETSDEAIALVQEADDASERFRARAKAWKREQWKALQAASLLATPAAAEPEA